VLHYIGAGQVLFHATAATWRWRLGAGDVYFARYWLQAIRRLCRAKLAESDGATLSADHRAPAAGEFAAASPSDELAQTRMDSAELRRAAERTGGRFYTFETADRLLSDLPTGRRSVVETLPPRPLWNAWPVLATFFALLVAEWVLRKRGGMV